MIIVYIMILLCILEVRRLFKKHEKKEAFVYIAIIVLTLPIALYVSMAPKFTSFVESVFQILGWTY